MPTQGREVNHGLGIQKFSASNRWRPIRAEVVAERHNLDVLVPAQYFG
jgi:hypothetical protein